MMLNDPQKANEAILKYQRAIAIAPHSAIAHYNLGNELASQNQLDAAIASYQKALEIDPNYVNAHYNLGNILVVRGKLDDAIKSYQKAIAIKPDFAEAHWNLFELLNRKGHFAEARQVAQQYILLCGDRKKVLSAISWIGVSLRSGLRETVKEDFLNLENLLYKSWDKLELQEVERLYANLLFDLPYLRDDVAANGKLARSIGQLYVRERIFKNPSVRVHAIAPQTRKKPHLRIGFLSPHFRRHSVGWCSADIIRELSHLTPHLYLYVADPEEFKADDRTQLFTRVAAKFYRAEKLSNGLANVGQLVEEIVRDEIDILIDLDSVMIPVHGEILYNQPAPVCISWLGFDAPFISERNYYLGDWHTHPAGVEGHYAEQLVRMPDSFMAVSGFASAVGERSLLRKSLRISSDQVVYLCVAPGIKFNNELAKAQVEILKHVPDSVLFHKGSGDRQSIKLIYKQACESQGVGFHRVKFLERSPTEEEHRTTYKIADILLDSYPYNGGTHNLEALWFNLPMVTQEGEQALARMGSSFLKTLGIEAGIAHSWEEYVAWGIRLGKDASLRNEIRDRLVKSQQPEHLAPLWNPKKFAKDMYALLEELLAKSASHV